MLWKTTLSPQPYQSIPRTCWSRVTYPWVVRHPWRSSHSHCSRLAKWPLQVVLVEEERELLQPLPGSLHTSGLSPFSHWHLLLLVSIQVCYGISFYSYPVRSMYMHVIVYACISHSYWPRQTIARYMCESLNLHVGPSYLIILHNVLPLPFVDMSEMAGHRVRYPSGESQCSSSSMTSLTRGRPKSANVIISKDKPYISPYAQSGMVALVQCHVHVYCMLDVVSTC